MAERKLDIFRVLKALDTKDVNFYANLSEEERKEFQPFLVTRWMSGISSARQVVFINELVNPYLFVTHIQRDHKDLLWRLMTLVTTGKSQRYFWNKLPGRASTSKPVSTKLLADKYNYSLREASDALECLSGNDILDLAEEMGVQSDDLAKIRKEFKDETLKADSIKTKSKKEKKKSAAEETDLFEY